MLIKAYGMTLRRLFGGALLLALAICSGAAYAEPAAVFEYRGWHVDLSRAANVQPLEASIASVDRQIDIVEAARLPPTMMIMLRDVPIWADPARRSAGPGHYQHDTGVDLHVRELEPDKPIVLHELLHALQDRSLGDRNADILRFYGRAKTIAAWPQDAYFLSNSHEFFAVTASVYLYGDIPRPPYSRALLQQNQPVYYQWLAQLFDNGVARPW